MATIFKNPSSASNNEEQLELLSIAAGKVKWQRHFGKHLAVSYKVTRTGADAEGRADCKQETSSPGKSGIVLDLLRGGGYTTV